MDCVVSHLNMISDNSGASGTYAPRCIDAGSARTATKDYLFARARHGRAWIDSGVRSQFSSNRALRLN
jgi:hypothetical protein